MSNWLTPEKLAGTAFAPREGSRSTPLPLGRLVKRGTAGDPLSFHGRAHLFCVAPSGTGKSQALAIPALLQWEHSVIVLDVKSELFDSSAAYRETQLGHTVHRFDPSNPAGAKFNPLSAIDRTDAAAIEQDVADIASVMVPISPELKEPFFRQSARQIIEAGLHALLYEYRDEKDPPPFSALIDTCFDPNRLFKAVESLGALAAGSEVPESAALLAASIKGQFFDSYDELTKTGQSVWSELGTHLAPLNTTQIRQVTKETSWRPGELRDGKTAIYLTLSPRAKGQYRSILALVMNAHLSELMSALPDNNAPPILLLLDEMPQLGHMRAIEQVIDLGRGYGLLLYGFAQRRQQIESSYGNAGDFLGTFQARLYMNPSPEDGSAKMLSDAIGQTGSMDTGKKQIVPVAPENELCGHEYRDDIIILSRGCSPARVRKQFAYEDDELRRRSSLGRNGKSA